MRMKTGVRNDGSLVAQTLQTALDGGAYGSYGVASTYYTGALQTVTYRLPRYRFDSVRAFTNKPACGPKRGHGTPQPRFGFEVQLDKIAVALGRNRPICASGCSKRPAPSPPTGCASHGSRSAAASRPWSPARASRALGQAPGGPRPRPRCGSYLCGAGLRSTGTRCRSRA